MAKVQCCPHKQEVYKKIPVSSQKSVCRIITAESAFLDIFFFGVVVRHYFTNCHLDSGSKWLMLVLPPTTVCRSTSLISHIILVWQVNGKFVPCLLLCCFLFMVPSEHGLRSIHPFRSQPVLLDRMGQNSSIAISSSQQILSGITAIHLWPLQISSQSYAPPGTGSLIHLTHKGHPPSGLAVHCKKTFSKQ